VTHNPFHPARQPARWLLRGQGPEEKKDNVSPAASALRRKGADHGQGRWRITDPTVLNPCGAIAGRGEQMALTELANGENSGRGLEDKATATRLSGEAAQTGSYYSAAGTLFSSIGGGFGKYANAGAKGRLGARHAVTALSHTGIVHVERSIMPTKPLNSRRHPCFG
jgi:hypothetical protein